MNNANTKTVFILVRIGKFSADFEKFIPTITYIESCFKEISGFYVYEVVVGLPTTYVCVCI